jgi:hypothetical protein
VKSRKGKESKEREREDGPDEARHSNSSIELSMLEILQGVDDDLIRCSFRVETIGDTEDGGD